MVVTGGFGPESCENQPRFPWRPFESLRREIDRLFEDFDGGLWPARSRRSFFDMAPFSGPAWAAPAVDFAETDKGYEVTAAHCRGPRWGFKSCT